MTNLAASPEEVRLTLVGPDFAPRDEVKFGLWDNAFRDDPTAQGFGNFTGVALKNEPGSHFIDGDKRRFYYELAGTFPKAQTSAEVLWHTFLGALDLGQPADQYDKYRLTLTRLKEKDRPSKLPGMVEAVFRSSALMLVTTKDDLEKWEVDDGRGAKRRWGQRDYRLRLATPFDYSKALYVPGLDAGDRRVKATSQTRVFKHQPVVLSLEVYVLRRHPGSNRKALAISVDPGSELWQQIDAVSKVYANIGIHLWVHPHKGIQRGNPEWVEHGGYTVVVVDPAPTGYIPVGKEFPDGKPLPVAPPPQKKTFPMGRVNYCLHCDQSLAGVAELDIATCFFCGHRYHGDHWNKTTNKCRNDDCGTVYSNTASMEWQKEQNNDCNFYNPNFYLPDGAGKLRAFYIHGFNQRDDRGSAFHVEVGYYKVADGTCYIRGSSDATTSAYTLAHEVGHVLTLQGHFGLDYRQGDNTTPNNLMKSGSVKNAPYGNRRLWPAQVKAIFGSRFLPNGDKAYPISDL